MTRAELLAIERRWMKNWDFGQEDTRLLIKEIRECWDIIQSLHDAIEILEE